MDVIARRLALMLALALAACGGGDDAPAEAPPGPEDGVSDQENPEMRYAPAREADPAFLEAYVETGYYRRGVPNRFAFLPDGSAVLYLRSGPRDASQALYALDVESGEERELLTSTILLGGQEEELTEEEAARRERMRLLARGITSFRLSADGAKLLVPLSGRVFVVDRAAIGQDGAVRELTSAAGPAIDPRFSPDGTKVACVRDGDLYVHDLAAGTERRLTTRPGPDVEHGLAEFVAQEEMGRFRGYWWSPDSQTILYQRTDHGDVERWHVTELAPSSPPAEGRPYPRPGQPNAAVTLGLIALDEGARTRWVEWDHEALPYVAQVTWPRQGALTVLAQDRVQERQVLMAVDPATGGTAPLHEETDDAWLNLDEAVPHWLSDGSGFLWSSERSGQWQLELRAADGTLTRTLTRPEDGYRRLLTVAEGTVWFLGGPEPSEDHVFRVPLAPEGDAPAEAERMTEAVGTHSAKVHRAGALWVHEETTLESTARRFTLRRGREIVAEIPAAVEAPPFEPNLERITDLGRRDWRAMVVRPRDLVEGVEYPVLVHVYGGPHARYVRATAAMYLLDQWYADHGFIVVRIDGRGTPARGREWERAIDGDFIAAPLEDQVEALQQLGDRIPEMDMERVGIFGWSFGGYFSAMAVLQRPSVFRAGVAGAPVCDWRDYDTHYTERYIGLPEVEGEEGAYHRSSVLTYATETAEANHRPLLIIHGSADDNVYLTHALKMQGAIFAAGRPADLIVLPGVTHMPADPALRLRMEERILGYFERHLRRPAP
jgi:dipeptidyl-peptidase-4